MPEDGRQQFPLGQRAMRPQFTLPETREQRGLERMIKTSNNRIPIIPFQPPSPPATSTVGGESSSTVPPVPEVVLNYDGQNDISHQFIADIVRETMKDMGVTEVKVRTTGKSTARGRFNKLSLMVKDQQAKMTKVEQAPCKIRLG
ncbi:hypothetical protein B0H14DRAFT_3451029 [Mycena olivaceomarginata]|nr:hypothetical protein B0H14DRAFT_3451029 [Mycena olivaceomarginata]